MMRLSRYLLLLLLMCVCAGVQAEDSIPKKKGGIINALYQFVKEFSRVDTNYVEPQHYNYTVMLQNTNTYEVYRITANDGKQITFAPNPSIKVGPYFGWRWIFLGYTFDLTHMNNSSKHDWTLSLYSNQIGLDLFYRNYGKDYKVRNLNFGSDSQEQTIKEMDFDGFSASVKGFNIYYIFNHRKFSYPAAYSQSTVQRRSAGSFLLGLGYTSHKLNVDWDKLYEELLTRMSEDELNEVADTTMHYTDIHYTDLSISAGYAYNWVFAHNWLLDVSLSLALAYNHSSSNSNRNFFTSFRDFSFKDLNLDGVSRIGVVWNNTRWYAGANAIFHSYNYRKSQFYTNNIFGSVNIYFGFNFGKR